MPQQKRKEKFIRLASTRHTGKYDYSKAEYRSHQEPISILCPIHGEFRQTPKDHLSGRGCTKCGIERRAQSSIIPFDIFEAKARKAHGLKYSYPPDGYAGMAAKATIVCQEHGEFTQRPKDHFNGNGCPRCGKRAAAKMQSSTKEAFVAKARKVHGDKYDYSKTDYVKALQPVILTCSTHGDFQVKPNAHLNGQGCKPCGVGRRTLKATLPWEDMLSRFKAAHRDRFTYDTQTYKGAHKKLRATCPDHGDFFPVAKDHADGHGCPKCGYILVSRALMASQETFIDQALQVHGALFKYDKVRYQGNNKNVEISCLKHGSFWQTPWTHLNSYGCPSCSIGRSEPELKLFEAVQAIFPDAIARDKSRLAGLDKRNLELDILIPSVNLAVEVNGLRWHSSWAEDQKGRNWVINHQADKQNICLSAGIRLLTVYSDEIYTKFDIVLGAIKAKAGHNSQKVFARKTRIVELSWSDASAFLDKYHIQGACRPAVAKGLIADCGSLVAVMAFGRTRSVRGNTDKGVYELARFASSVRVVGGASKLLKAFIASCPEATQIVSYADKRVSAGDLYKAVGFEMEWENPPDYCYIVKGRRVHKAAYKRQYLPNLLENFNPALTERENCHNHGIYQLFNCGLQRWSLNLQPTQGGPLPPTKDTR